MAGLNHVSESVSRIMQRQLSSLLEMVEADFPGWWWKLERLECGRYSAKIGVTEIYHGNFDSDAVTVVCEGEAETAYEAMLLAFENASVGKDFDT